MRRSTYKKHLLALAGFLLVWLIAAASGAASAQNAARIYLTPAEPALVAGERTTLTIRVDGATDLYGVELRLAYDPAVMEVLDADASQSGTQLRPGGLLDPEAGFMVVNNADNQAGELEYAITLLAPAEAVSGAGVLVSFEVRALADGSSELALSVILASADGVALPVRVEGGRLTVGDGVGPNPTPTPQSTATPRPSATATPTTRGQGPGQSPSSTPVTGQAKPTAGQTATATGVPGASPTPTLPPANQPGANDVTKSAQSEPEPTEAALAALASSPAATEEQVLGGEAVDPRPSPEAAPISPSSSGASGEAGQDANPALAGGLILTAFLLLALVIFFGRRLLRRKL